MDIYSSVSCSTHSKQTNTASSSETCVSLFLCPDTAVLESEDVSKWRVVYHGTSLPVINSILIHGMLLMQGDELSDGEIVGKRLASDDQEKAVWTYPKPGGAKIAASTGTFDDGQTEFKILIRLRQKPGTYEKHSKGGFGYDVWSTNRRGTLYMEALEVYVVKSRGTVSPNPFMSIPVKSYFKTFKCPAQQQAFEVMQLLKLPESLFDMTHNRCYCPKCYPDTWPSALEMAGARYIIPRGWVRFGLLVNPVFAKLNDIWKSWNIAFHGCHPANVSSIVKHRALLIPHDILPDGKRLQVCCSADKNQKYYFVSPQVGYSAHPWYAKPVPFIDSDGKRKYLQTVIVFKVTFRARVIFCWLNLTV
jgi:hypothetical protein